MSVGRTPIVTICSANRSSSQTSKQSEVLRLGQTGPVHIRHHFFFKNKQKILICLSIVRKPISNFCQIICFSSNFFFLTSCVLIENNKRLEVIDTVRIFFWVITWWKAVAGQWISNCSAEIKMKSSSGDIHQKICKRAKLQWIILFTK